MKKLIPIIILATCAVAFAADPVPAKKGSGIPLAERKRMAAERMLKMTGGFVVKPGEHGKIVYLNGQTNVSSEVISKQTTLMSELMSVNVTLIKGASEFTLTDAISRRDAAGANAAIFFVNDSTVKEPMLVAPESGWAMVNLAALTTDSPSQEKLDKRVIRETWRSFAYLLGAADSVEPRCILRPVTKNEDLDKLVADCFCPEPLDKIVAHLQAIGIDASARKTYRQACKEGWAPAPTNDYQKAIWNEFHQLPTKPIKIDYDPKAGK